MHMLGFSLSCSSLLSIYEDRSQQRDGEEDQKEHRRNMLSFISFAAFAFLSVSLSKQIRGYVQFFPPMSHCIGHENEH